MLLKSILLSIVKLIATSTILLYCCCSFCIHTVNANDGEDTNIAILDLHRLRRKFLLIKTDTKRNSITNIQEQHKQQQEHERILSSKSSVIKQEQESTQQQQYDDNQNYISSSNNNERLLLLDTSEMIWDITHDSNRFLMSFSFSMSM